MKQKIPDHCKGCKSHYAGGVKDGKHNNWCCWAGQAAPKVAGHCKNVGGRKE